MTNDITQIEENDFDQALALVPEEIQEFMWDGALDYILDVAKKAVPLTETEKISMKTASEGLLLGISDMEQETKRMLAEGIEPEKITKMMFIIHTEILVPVKNIMDHYKEDTDTTPTESSSSMPSVSSDALSRMSQTFNTTATLAPTKRTYTDIPNTSTESPKPITETLPLSPKRDIDPYRELPDEK